MLYELDGSTESSQQKRTLEIIKEDPAKPQRFRIMTPIRECGKRSNLIYICFWQRIRHCFRFTYICMIPIFCSIKSVISTNNLMKAVSGKAGANSVSGKSFTSDFPDIRLAKRLCRHSKPQRLPYDHRDIPGFGRYTKFA